LPQAADLADLLVQGTEKVAVMVGLLRQLSKVSDRLMALAVELNQRSRKLHVFMPSYWLFPNLHYILPVSDNRV
jgi:hypothetical protein